MTMIESGKFEEIYVSVPFIKNLSSPFIVYTFITTFITGTTSIPKIMFENIHSLLTVTNKSKHNLLHSKYGKIGMVDLHSIIHLKAP